MENKEWFVSEELGCWRLDSIYFLSMKNSKGDDEILIEINDRIITFRVYLDTILLRTLNTVKDIYSLMDRLDIPICQDIYIGGSNRQYINKYGLINKS